MTTQEEYLSIVHELKEIETVDRVARNLIMKAEGLLTKNDKRMDIFKARIDSFVSDNHIEIK